MVKVSKKFEQLEKLCVSHGLTLRECKWGHWQITGGVARVNFYANTKRGDTMYVNGMAGGARNATFASAIEAAQGAAVSVSARHERQRLAKRKAAKIRKRLHEKQNGLCAICKEPVDPNDGNLDHRIPISKGGSTGSDNLQLTHTQCNFDKSNAWPVAQPK